VSQTTLARWMQQARRDPGVPHLRPLRAAIDSPHRVRRKGREDTAQALALERQDAGFEQRDRAGLPRGRLLRGLYRRRIVPSEGTIDADAIVAGLRPVLERRGVLRAVLFGSFATGRQTRRSDVDLLLVVRTDAPFFDRCPELLAEIRRAVPGRDVEVLAYTPEELERIRHRPFIARALSEGKVIHERREAAA
jgi:predicted nucleotidyltransferase